MLGHWGVCGWRSCRRRRHSPPGDGLGDQFEKRQELGVGVARVAGIGNDLAGGDVQVVEQVVGAVADVVMGLLFRNPFVQRQKRLGSVQRPDLGFVVDTEYDRSSRGTQVELDHVAQLGLEGGGEFEGLHAVRLDVPLAPDPGYRDERDPQQIGHQPRRPV